MEDINRIAHDTQPAQEAAAEQPTYGASVHPNSKRLAKQKAARKMAKKSRRKNRRNKNKT